LEVKEVGDRAVETGNPSWLANININNNEAATTRTTTLIAHVGDDAFCGLSHQMQFDGAVQKLFFELSTNLATAARQATQCPQVYESGTGFGSSGPRLSHATIHPGWPPSPYSSQ